MSKGRQQSAYGQQQNLFDSEEEEDDEELEPQLKAMKPYEEHLDKYVVWYNDFFTKTTQFEDKRQIHHGTPDFSMINISYQALEHRIGIFDIINSKDKNLNKIATTFIYLDLEVQQVKEIFKNKLYNIVMLYGEQPETQDQEEVALKDGQAEIELSRIFQGFRQIYDFVKKLMGIIYNIINQLNQLYNKKEPFFRIFKNVDLFFALDTIGQALQIIYVLDCIVKDQESLETHWNLYKKMLKIVKTEPEKYGSNAFSIKQLEKMLSRLDKTVMSGNCILGVLNSSWDQNANLTSNALKNGTQQLMPKNKELLEFFRKYFKHKLQVIQVIGQQRETNEREEIMNLFGVYALFRRIYPSEEERNTYKAFWTIQKKVPILEGHCHIIIYIYQYLTDICPLQKKSSSLDPKLPVDNVNQYIKYTDNVIESQINLNYQLFCTWISRMESIITSNPNTFEGIPQQAGKEGMMKIVNDRLDTRIKLIINGLRIAYQVRSIIHDSVLLHLSQQIEIPMNSTKSIRMGIEMMKAIKFMFNQKVEAFNPTVLTKFLVKGTLQMLMEKIKSQKKLDEGLKKPERSEIIGSLTLMYDILKHPLNHIKIVTLNFLLNVVQSRQILTLEECEELKHLVSKIEFVNQYQYLAQRSTECSFIYSSKELVPVFFKNVFENPVSAKRLPFFVQIFDDCSFLKEQTHLTDKNALYNSFQTEVLIHFNEQYLIPTIRAVEDFLRVNIHTMLLENLQGHNPYKQQSTDINRLLNLNTIQIFEKTIDIRQEVTSYLNQSFYNINVLNMHDMATYELMRSLANFKFNLSLMHVYIPSQTIDQGQMDILQIIRSIPAFVQKYTYNLYNQQFIEITSESKQLTSITIQQISDSIKTHGLGKQLLNLKINIQISDYKCQHFLGILNTSVNFVYQFILKRINNFSQFLFDEYVYSPLRREFKYFKENNEALDGKYPFERAEHLYKEIKRLGTFEDGKNFLDKFRIMITEIGNALGFVRLLRSSSLNYCSSSIEFLPSTMTKDIKFSDLSKDASMGDTTQQAAEELDDVFEYLRGSFSSRSDYLKILVKAFKKILSHETEHLKLFYMLLPALTVNFVETIMLAKERLSKNNPFNAYFCDDGFIVGVSYFLRLLNQTEDFQSLHWKEEISAYFKKHLQTVKNMAEKQNTNKRLAEDVDMQKGLSIRKLNNQLDEYELFFNAFHSCKILFREDTN